MDHELEALDVIVGRLVTLDRERRRRVLAYLLDRFANDLPARDLLNIKRPIVGRL
jgi:hypothetical protein